MGDPFLPDLGILQTLLEQRWLDRWHWLDVKLSWQSRFPTISCNLRPLFHRIQLNDTHRHQECQICFGAAA